MPENTGYHIYSFMRNDLKLKSHELNVYAVIFEWSQSDLGCFCGTREYLSACTGANISTISRMLKSLVDKKLILKKTSMTNTGITNVYTINLDKITVKVKKH
jgi:predicted transcriptional regulator